jgi:hypothetical protein
VFSKQRVRSALLRTLATLLLLLISAGAAGASAGAAGASARQTQENPCEDFDPNNFSNSTNIDNQWFPLQPGTQFVSEGSTEEGGESIPHRTVFTVTDLTKVIGGVRTIIVWDRDYSKEQLEEAELALFAQDNDGNIWHFGQYPEEYEDGKVVKAPAWIAGIQDARAGISIKADPQLGAPSYCQGWGPAVGWNDRAEVAEVGQHTCVPLGCYDDVLVTEEFSKDEPNAFQLKYYARGVGNVRVGWKGEDATKETLELVNVVHLSPEALADVRAQALELEKRAYENSKDVYAHTPPAELASTGAPAQGGGAPVAGGSDSGPASLPRTGAESAKQWPVELLLVLGLGLGAAGWVVRRRAARN